MNKADLFKQIGWSQELIDHFTIAMAMTSLIMVLKMHLLNV